MKRRKVREVTSKEAMQHAGWAVASLDAWARYLWEHLENTNERIDYLQEQLEEVLPTKRKPTKSRGKFK